MAFGRSIDASEKCFIATVPGGKFPRTPFYAAIGTQ